MNALILHAGALGDCVLTLHVAMALRKLGNHLTVAARSPIAAWAAKRDLIDDAILLDRLSPLLWAGNSNSETDHSALVEKYDRVISFLGGTDEEVARRLKDRIGADRTVHIDPRPTETSIREGTHITQQWVEELNKQGLDFKFEISNLKYKDAAYPWSKSIDVKSPHHHTTTLPNLIVHPGSGGRAKCCPIEHLEALLIQLVSRGVNAQWMIGPDEVERDGQAFCRRLERTAQVIFEECLETAADRAAGADAFIGNDAGLTHVAALAGVNTVALFGHTDPRVWRPLGPNCTIVKFPETEPIGNWVASVTRQLTVKP